MDQSGMEELRELVQFLKENGVAEFDMERPELKVRLKFAGAAAAGGGSAVELSRLLASLPHGASPEAGSTAHGAAVDSVGVAIPTSVAAVAEETMHEVRSPLVGTFYESSSPGSPSFVKVGDQVEVGQVLCIVEAMKLMNEIESDVAGEVVRRIAESGQPVEYGQPLFAIRPR